MLQFVSNTKATYPKWLYLYILYDSLQSLHPYLANLASCWMFIDIFSGLLVTQNVGLLSVYLNNQLCCESRIFMFIHWCQPKVFLMILGQCGSHLCSCQLFYPISTCSRNLILGGDEFMRPISLWCGHIVTCNRWNWSILLTFWEASIVVSMHWLVYRRSLSKHFFKKMVYILLFNEATLSWRSPWNLHEIDALVELAWRIHILIYVLLDNFVWAPHTSPFFSWLWMPSIEGQDKLLTSTSSMNGHGSSSSSKCCSTFFLCPNRLVSGRIFCFPKMWKGYAFCQRIEHTLATKWSHLEVQCNNQPFHQLF